MWISPACMRASSRAHTCKYARTCTYAYTFTGMGTPACMRTPVSTRAPSRVCSHLHGHAHPCTGTGSPARPWSRFHGYAYLYGHAHACRPWAHPNGTVPFRSPGTLPPRPAAGAANPQPAWSRKFTGPATSPLKCTSDQLTQIPTSNDWGAWVWHRLAMRRRRRRRDVAATSRRQGARGLACVIGPEGPMDDPPEGGPLRAGTVRLTADFDGSFALSSNGLPTNWHGKSSVEYGQCLTHISASNLPPNRRVRQIKHRIRPVPDSHLHPIRLPTSGFAVEPEGSTYNRPWKIWPMVPVSTPTTVNRHGSHRGLIRDQVSQKNLRRRGPACWFSGLKAKPMAWPDPVWSGLV